MKTDEAVIRIKKVGEKDNKFWIQDEAGEFYSGFKQWEGANNTEYNMLMFGNHNEPFKEGDMATIKFTKSVGKDDKIYKNLKGIFPAGLSDAIRPTSQAEKPHHGANNASSERLNPYQEPRVTRDEFSRRLGIQGHLNALLSNPNVYHHSLVEDPVDINSLIKRAIQIEDELEKKLTGPVKSVKPGISFGGPTIPFNADDDEIPTIQQEDLSGIPF